MGEAFLLALWYGNANFEDIFSLTRRMSLRNHVILTRFGFGI